MKPLDQTPSPPPSPPSDNKRKFEDPQNFKEQIGEIVEKRMRTEPLSSKTICHYEIKEIEQKKTLSIQAFWGNFTIELGQINELPETHIKETFSEFWKSKIVPGLETNKAVHLKLGVPEDHEPLARNDVVLFEVKKNQYLALQAVQGEKDPLLGSGNTFYVYRMKDLISSEEFALAIHRFNDSELLMPKQDLLENFIHSETIVGSQVRMGLEIKALGTKETPLTSEMYIAPVAKHGTLKDLEKSKTIEEALLKSLELLNQIHFLHKEQDYVHADLNLANVLIIDPSPPIFMFTDLDSLTDYDTENDATFKDFQDAFELVKDLLKEPKPTENVPEEFLSTYTPIINFIKEKEEDPSENDFNELHSMIKEQCIKHNLELAASNRLEKIQEFWSPFDKIQSPDLDDVKELVFKTCFEIQEKK